MKEVNWPTLITGLVAAGKLMLNSFGIDIPDELINDFVNGAAAVIAIAAIFMSHRKKGGTPDASSQYQGDTDSSV